MAQASQLLPTPDRADQGQIVVGVDPLAFGELLEQGAVEPARGAVVDVFDAGLLAEFCGAQPRRQPLVAPKRRFPIEQQSEPVMAIEPFRLVGLGEFGEGLGHSVKAEGVELVEGRMFEQVASPNDSSAGRGYWGEGSGPRPRRALAPASDRACCRGWI